MESSDRGMNEGAEAEEQQVLGLRAVLHDLVRRKGRAEAARELGLDPRTVDACLDGEGMSWRVREAVERAIQGDQGAGAAQQREKMRALERRVDALEQRMEGHTQGAGDGNGVHGAGQADADRQAERTPGAPGAAKPPATAAGAPGPERNVLGRRLYPELVTRELASDDHEVYGEAWPLIEEWREIWKAGHRGTGRGLAWLRAEERVRALEVALLEEHGLTLPPEKMPLYGLDRRDQLVWRQKTLSKVRRALAWAQLGRWARRLLTLGLWRN